MLIKFSFITFQMLKHVQISPLRSRSDSISLRSSTSFSSNSSCASSLCGSPEPLMSDFKLETSSRSSSYSSLNESVPQVRRQARHSFAITRQLSSLLSAKVPSSSLSVCYHHLSVSPIPSESQKRVGRVIVPLCDKK